MRWGRGWRILAVGLVLAAGSFGTCTARRGMTLSADHPADAVFNLAAIGLLVGLLLVLVGTVAAGVEAFRRERHDRKEPLE